MGNFRLTLEGEREIERELHGIPRRLFFLFFGPAKKVQMGSSSRVASEREKGESYLSKQEIDPLCSGFPMEGKEKSETERETAHS